MCCQSCIEVMECCQLKKDYFRDWLLWLLFGRIYGMILWLFDNILLKIYT